jgi:hypothetical protein
VLLLKTHFIARNIDGGGRGAAPGREQLRSGDNDTEGLQVIADEIAELVEARCFALSTHQTPIKKA